MNELSVNRDGLTRWSPFEDAEQKSDKEADMLLADHDEQPNRLRDTLEDNHRLRASRRRRTTAILFVLIVLSAVLNVIQFVNSTKSGLPSTLAHTEPPHKQHSSESNDVSDKAIVLASTWGQNLSWSSKVPSDWRFYRYIMDDQRPYLEGSQEGEIDATSEDRLSDDSLSTTHGPAQARPVHTYTVPRNQGHEAMAYLTFIIDNYEKLPLFTLFLHGHDRSWNQHEHTYDIVNALNLSDVATNSYASVRCNVQYACHPDKRLNVVDGSIKHGDKASIKDAARMPAFWKLIFPNGPAPPLRLAAAKGAQFAVTREAIRARPLKFWHALRRPIERDLNDYKKILPSANSHDLGLLYEHVWHVIFGKPALDCPTDPRDEDYCRQTVLSGAISCKGQVDSYPPAPGDVKNWRDVQCDIDEEGMGRAEKEQDEAVKRARDALL